MRATTSTTSAMATLNILAAVRHHLVRRDFKGRTRTKNRGDHGRTTMGEGGAVPSSSRTGTGHHGIAEKPNATHTPLMTTSKTTVAPTTQILTTRKTRPGRLAAQVHAH